MQHILTLEDLPQDLPFLEGIESGSRHRMLSNLQAQCVSYDAGTVMCKADALYSRAVYLVSGTAEGYVYDSRGNRSILHIFTPGQIISYGTLFGGWKPTYDVMARNDAKVAIFETERLQATSERFNRSFALIVNNLATSMAELNAQMMTTLEIRTRRTSRGKIIAYLEMESRRQGSTSIDIDLSRQELADYLSVDRASLSRELGALRDEGQFTYSRNHFDLTIQPRVQKAIAS